MVSLMSISVCVLVLTFLPAQRHGMVLWDKVFYEVAKEYEGIVEHDKMLVDAMTVRMVNKPESLDTIVATNRKCTRLTSRRLPC